MGVLDQLDEETRKAVEAEIQGRITDATKQADAGMKILRWLSDNPAGLQALKDVKAGRYRGPQPSDQEPSGDVASLVRQAVNEAVGDLRKNVDTLSSETNYERAERALLKKYRNLTDDDRDKIAQWVESGKAGENATLEDVAPAALGYERWGALVGESKRTAEPNPRYQSAAPDGAPVVEHGVEQFKSSEDLNRDRARLDEQMERDFWAAVGGDK